MIDRMVHMNVDLDKYLFTSISFFYKLQEKIRSCYILLSLKKSGETIMHSDTLSKLNIHQKEDGGCCDVNDTTVFSFLIKDIPNLKPNYNRALKWLNAQKIKDAGWGRTQRDIPRIPMTGLLLTLLPEMADDASLSWLEREWTKELHSETKLTYKGAFTLMAFASTGFTPQNPSLITDTLEYLVSEQNEDGGFGPWKGHPVGSEPWSTGIDLIGLLSFPDLVKPEIIEKALDWLAKNQLPNGLWPCHYIEEGSSYCYWGAIEALKYLKRINR
jgi:hypothetical protein